MSGHSRSGHDLSPAELDDLLAHALAHPKIKARLARPFKLIVSFDIALLGSSGVGGLNVYFDRHLQGEKLPYGSIWVGRKPLDVRRGLTRHERLEQATEDLFGWPYTKLAHPVAQHFEEKDYRAKGFDPAAVERAFEPFIKFDEHERIQRSPTDLDMRPLLAPPRSTELIEHVNQTAQKEKKNQKAVGYVAASSARGQCQGCAMFVKEKYGGPACTTVQSPIHPQGRCRLFEAGALGAEK